MLANRERMGAGPLYAEGLSRRLGEKERHVPRSAGPRPDADLDQAGWAPRSQPASRRPPGSAEQPNAHRRAPTQRDLGQRGPGRRGAGYGSPGQRSPGQRGPGPRDPGQRAGYGRPGLRGPGQRSSGQRDPGRRNAASGSPDPRQYRPVPRALLALLTTFVFITGWSVVHALIMPGGGTVSERLAEWARDHELGPVVTLGEWLSYQPPKRGGKPSFTLTGPSAAVGKRSSGQDGHGKRAGMLPIIPARLASPAGRPLKGEGIWRVVATVHGVPAIYATYLRPSRIYTSYVAGIVSMDQRLLRFELRPGAEDPGPGRWRAQPTIAPGTRSGLVATFNGGFKIASAGGGFYLNGATAGTLQPGAASLVYYRDGRVAAGAWDRTVRMTPQVAGVRQNLRLIVDHGVVPSSVDQDVESSWGATLGGSYHVWRSGIGVTADGRVIFVYAPALDVQSLADLLRRAGCVEAMQLDINPDWMSFMYYLPEHHPANPTPINLLPDQVQPADRYYAISNRDFTAVYAK